MRRGKDPALLMEDLGLRPTEVRGRVLAALRSAGGPLSHPELAAILADCDRVTVFRSLKALRVKGLLHCVQGMDGVLRYVANGDGAVGCPGGHPHFLCERCGAMICLPDQEVPRVEVPRGSIVRGKQLLAYGLCAGCAARERRGEARERRGEARGRRGGAGG